MTVHQIPSIVATSEPCSTFALCRDTKNCQTSLEMGAKNAQYFSKTAQNGLLVCIKENAQEEIIKEVQSEVSDNGVAFYGMQVDEFRNVSNVEQLGVVIRYIKENGPVE